MKGQDWILGTKSTLSVLISLGDIYLKVICTQIFVSSVPFSWRERWEIESKYKQIINNCL